MPSTHALKCKNSTVFPALLRWSLRQLFVNPNQGIDLIFQSDAILICAVVAKKNARVPFGSQNVSVSEHFDSHDRSSHTPAVRVMIINKCDRALRINTHESGVVERCHVERIRVVAHLLQGKMKRKIERR